MMRSKPESLAGVDTASQSAKGTHVRRKFRPQLTYANVMSTLAVFIALGGSSYAAVTLNGSSIKHRSIPGAKLKRNTLTGAEIRESRLGRVPRAAMADRLGADATAALKVRCPDDMFPVASVCIDKAPRPAAPYGSAVSVCLGVGIPQGPGRRLPTHGELLAAMSTVSLSPGGELTGDVIPSSQHPGEVEAVYLTDQFGRIGLTPDRFEGAKPFRCAADPIN
jgi:hypothetical protein